MCEGLVFRKTCYCRIVFNISMTLISKQLNTITDKGKYGINFVGRTVYFKAYCGFLWSFKIAREWCINTFSQSFAANCKTEREKIRRIGGIEILQLIVRERCY